MFSESYSQSLQDLSWVVIAHLEATIVFTEWVLFPVISHLPELNLMSFYHPIIQHHEIMLKLITISFRYQYSLLFFEKIRKVIYILSIPLSFYLQICISAALHNTASAKTSFICKVWTPFFFFFFSFFTF